MLSLAYPVLACSLAAASSFATAAGPSGTARSPEAQHLASAASASSLPQSFSATYDIEWRGMGAGVSTLELVRLGGNEYTYRSSNVARGFFRFAFPDTITQTSRFSVVDGVVMPSSYRSDDGSAKTDKDVTLEFNWRDSVATGVAENKQVNLQLRPGTQDSLSVQIALMMELAAGRSPDHFWLLDKNEVKEYQYAHEGNVTLNTPLGKLDTVIYRSTRAGSTRVTRLWLAPSLGYLPLRAEQIRNGRREFALSIRSATRS